MKQEWKQNLTFKFVVKKCKYFIRADPLDFGGVDAFYANYCLFYEKGISE